MEITKEEKNHIIIWRLLKKISVKHGEGYYSLNISPKEINTGYYLPKTAHSKFDNEKETIKSLNNLLKISTIEYKTDLEGMEKRLVELKEKKREIDKTLKNYKRDYNKVISNLNK